MQDIHNHHFEAEEIQFQNHSEFTDWKVNEERKINSAYVQQCAPKKSMENKCGTTTVTEQVFTVPGVKVYIK